MNKEENNVLSQPSATEETTPLLSKKETAGIYSKVTKVGECTSEPDWVPCPAFAGSSRTSDKNEASLSAADEAVLKEDIAKKIKKSDEEEMAEHISSYEGMVDIVSPSFGCGPFYGIWLCMCHCLSSFTIQLPLHILLLSLPISVGFMGARYMTQCPMNTKLPYAMMVIGGLGTLVLFVRLALLLHTKFSNDELLRNWLKKGTKLLECVFLLCLVIEVCFSYKKNSISDDPLSPNYCEKSFYSFFCSMNDVLITLVVLWIFLYFVTGQRCMRRSAPP